MNRLYILLIAFGVGVAGFALFYHRAEQFRATNAVILGQWQSATNGLNATQKAISVMRTETQEKRKRLRQLNQHPNFSREMLEMLEGVKFRGNAMAWAELRQQLGIGWDTSPDFVLVRKQAIQGVWFNKLDSNTALSDDAVKLLDLSLDEQKAISVAIAAAREGQWLNVKSTPPSGNIVAQYTITPPDSAFTAGQSNTFATDVTTAIGSERANIFLPDAWRELRAGMAPTEAETLTIRQTYTDGEPDLVSEVTQGSNVSAEPIRYAHYPAFPLLKLFPGGWQAVAQTAGFELPPSFHK